MFELKFDDECRSSQNITISEKGSMCFMKCYSKFFASSEAMNFHRLITLSALNLLSDENNNKQNGRTFARGCAMMTFMKFATEFDSEKCLIISSQLLAGKFLFFKFSPKALHRSSPSTKWPCISLIYRLVALSDGKAKVKFFWIVS